jgi:hypothetical protein
VSDQVMPKYVREDTLYTCAYKPGLNESRWGTRWLDGVAPTVPGATVLTCLVGTVSPLAIYPHGTPIRWDRGRPVPKVSPLPPTVPADLPVKPEKPEKPAEPSLEDMTRAQLSALCDMRGLEVGRRSKAPMIAALRGDED